MNARFPLLLAVVSLLPLLAPGAVAGNLMITNVGAPTQRTGVLETWTLQFTTASAVGGNGEVRVLFPPGFQVMDDPPASCRFLSPGTIQYAGSFAIGREVLCILGGTDTIAAGANVRIEITGVRNPTTAQTTEAFLVQTRDQNDTVIDENGGNSEVILVHSFSGTPDHRNPNLVVGAVTTHSFGFTLFNGWAQNGILELTFPNGYVFDVAGPGTTVATFTEGGSGHFTTPVTEGRTLYFQRQGGGPIYGGSEVRVNITQIRNPLVPGTTTPFTVTTSNATRADHDTGQAPGDSIVSALATTSSNASESLGRKAAEEGAPGFAPALLLLAALLVLRRRH